MSIIFGNNAQSTLAGAISNTATTANLAAGTGILFPSPTTPDYFIMTFVDAATGLLNEIVHVTNVTGDQVTMVRGQEGTTPLAWSAGDIAAALVTAGALTSFLQQGQIQVFPARIVTSSANFTLALADYRIGLNRTTAPAATQITLPNGAAVGQAFVIDDLAKNCSQYPVTIVPPAGTIGNGPNFEMIQDGQSVTVAYYGSNIWGVEG